MLPLFHKKSVYYSIYQKNYSISEIYQLAKCNNLLYIVVFLWDQKMLFFVGSSSTEQHNNGSMLTE